MIRKLLSTLLLLLTANSYAIDTTGITGDRLKAIKREIPAAFGPNATLPMLDDAIKRLYRTGEYETVQLLQRNDGSYIIAGTPIKRIKSIIIEGNDNLSQSEIKSLMEIPEDSQFDRNRIAEGAERLKARYGELGYLNSRIEADFKEDEKSLITVTIKVIEGLPCRLDEINFITNNTELKTALNKLSRSYKSKPIEKDTLANISQDIRNYFLSNRYLIATIAVPEVNFNPEKTSATMSLSVERPFKFILFMEGNEYFTSMEILRKIAISSDNPTGANPAAELAGRIKTLYLEKGFANVLVDFNERVYASEFNKQIVFKIQEGPRVKIADIQIDGSISKHKEWYLDFISDQSQSVKKYGYYNRVDLDKSLEAMVFELQNEGFLRARVRSTRVEYSKRRDFVTIQLLLEEGPQTKIRDIIFKGNTQFTTKELLDAIDLQPNTPISLKKVEASVRRLEDYYTSLGYLDMKVSNPLSELVTYTEDNLNAVITFEILEGPKIKVANIIVEGNEKTKDYVILKELEFERGDVLTPGKISDSIGRLQRTQLFSEVTILTLEKDTPIADRTISVRVTERYPGQFKSGVGLNTEFDLTARGYLGVGYRNLSGTARGLSSRLELNRVTDIDFMDHRLTSSYLEPYLLNSRTRGLVNLTRSYSIKKRDRALDQVIATDANEVEFLLEREFTKNIKLTWNLWSVASIIDFEIDDKIPNESQVIATVGPTLEFEFRDNPFNPVTGYYARLNSEYSTPYIGSSNKITYTRTNAVFTHYLPLLSKRWVWANSLRGGYVKNLDPESGIPDSKLFYLGGRSTIRGFDTGSIPPRATVRPLNGESHFYLFKTELRFPIYNDLGGVLFYDGGGVNIIDNEISAQSATENSLRNDYPGYRDAVGVGIRYNTPVGPVSAEYGYKLNRQQQRGESEGRFHFSIGAF